MACPAIRSAQYIHDCCLLFRIKIVDLINQLKRVVTYNLQTRPADAGLSDLGMYSCQQSHRLSEVPIFQPTLLIVLNGSKTLYFESNEFEIRPGKIMLLPADTQFLVENQPASDGSLYLGVALRFPKDAIDQFRDLYGSRLDQWALTPVWQAAAPEEAIHSLTQWLSFERNTAMDPDIVRHRQIEILLHLAKAGLAGNLLIGSNQGWKQKTRHHLSMNPAQGWQIQDICIQLGTSESSLRRHLQEEGTTFREILEEVRLANGLAMLWETPLSIARVAEASGYQSQSRFTERFKLRFGMTPSELRRTLPGGQTDPAISAAG